MLLPRWIPFVVAAWVIAFGVMRLRIAFGKQKTEDEPNFRKGGYYARSSRSHAFFGIAYLILGAYCLAMGFGYQIDFFGGCLGKEISSERRSSDQGVPIDVSPR